MFPANIVVPLPASISIVHSSNTAKRRFQGMHRPMNAVRLRQSMREHIQRDTIGNCKLDGMVLLSNTGGEGTMLLSHDLQESSKLIGRRTSRIFSLIKIVHGVSGIILDINIDQIFGMQRLSQAIDRRHLPAKEGVAKAASR
ncbi:MULTISPECIES: hypothetical protein [Burkholderia cepacia complex]|uniref:hypothetical protein n=1 Tax=Burkholderia cepacia complex TaxID=87882 RepID=UPI00165172C0|nr:MULTISPECIES: hypothetical protein [Burkholderia cepacia complex]MBR8403842.1 hypothetical protein [Burkholderia cenocepacia]UIY59748.1 hypothetical protein LZ568_32650 [Burkholderia cepacia]UJH77457.1 hypothetical protein L0U95_22525 [Burkholderia cenocepacia]UTV57039.1 hypothetical protein NLX30_28420 [Burkholderia arboris]